MGSWKFQPGINLNDHDVIKRYIVQVKIGVTYRMLAVSLKFVNMEIF